MTLHCKMGLVVILLGLASCKRRPQESVRADVPRPTTSASGGAAAAPSAKAGPSAGPATLFESTRFGMSREELLQTYGSEVTAGVVPRFPGDSPPIIVRRVIDGVELEVALHVREHGLDMIELGSVKTNVDPGECESDQIKVESWIEKRAGAATERTGYGTHWRLPTVHIEVYCDEGLGGIFEPPEKP